MPSHSDDVLGSGLTHHGDHPAGREVLGTETPENPPRMVSESSPQVSCSQQLGDVLERVSDALVALDKDWGYTYVNR